MVTTALQVGPLSGLTRRMFLADQVQTYKPSRAIYDGLLGYINSTPGTQKVSGQNVWLVSG